MNCPHCNDPRNRVLETRENSRENAIRRRHACRGCGKSFTSVQRIEIYDDGAWQPVALAVVPDPQPVQVVPVAPRKRAAAAERLHPLTGHEEWLAFLRADLPADLFVGLLEWWNESRWGKHRTNATWTQAAFTLSANRVSNLYKLQGRAAGPTLARALVNGGIEHGWQALKPEYLRGITSAVQPAAAPAGDPAAAAIRDMLERGNAA
jgi:hypothetical protein